MRLPGERAVLDPCAFFPVPLRLATWLRLTRCCLLSAAAFRLAMHYFAQSLCGTALKPWEQEHFGHQECELALLFDCFK